MVTRQLPDPEGMPGSREGLRMHTTVDKWSKLATLI
jgi:hypothetical protein